MRPYWSPVCSDLVSGCWAFAINAPNRAVPGRSCPWQNGRVERFIGTVKRALGTEPIAGEGGFAVALKTVRAWYNHERPHDHLQGRTPAEVWAGIDVFALRSRTGTVTHNTSMQQESS